MKVGVRGNTVRNEPYLVINMAFALFIALILLYSLVFSPLRDNYPIPCIHERITGEECPSCGISHSFSFIVRGRIAEAYTWNSRGMSVFIFFVAQLLLRISFFRSYLKNPDSRRQLIITDITGSSLMFLIAFMPFILFLFRQL
ncbi:MAG: DUF2752 domain-containing protein [Bacteroidales bacterium]|nr:DUF2752 domain-containing protein [Bacteroidales bacterium]